MPTSVHLQAGRTNMGLRITSWIVGIESGKENILGTGVKYPQVVPSLA